MAAALSGVRVLEVARFDAAPFCGKLLAGFGAEVLKIEPPGTGDPARAAGPFKDDKPDREGSVPFLYLNTGKQSMTLDLETDEGREILHCLLADTDVLLTDLKPRDLERLQIDYPSLEERYPTLILAAISFYGQTGPYRDYEASELTGFAMSGYLSITGEANRAPVKIAGNLAQYEGGLHAATGIMAALLQRNLTARGQLVDASIAEASCFSASMIGPWLNTSDLFRRDGNRHPTQNPHHGYPTSTLPCKDGWVHLHYPSSGNDLIALLLEEPRLLDPEFAEAPRAHADAFDTLCLPWLRQHDKFEIVERAQELRLPFTEVLDAREVLNDPQHAARGYFDEVDHPVVGRTVQVGAPFQASATPWQTSRAPLLGEHNEALSCRWRKDQLSAVAAVEARRPRSGQAPLPLAGVRIADLTIAVAGPAATALLAELGAEVIKVEHVNARLPRSARAAASTPAHSTNEQPYNRTLAGELHRSKKAIALNLAQPEAREAFLRLVEVSDVVIDNFSPRVMPNFGFSYERLREIRPDIIMLSMPAFGSTGPYANRVSFGPGIDAMSGLQSLSGYPDSAPIKPGHVFSDYNTAVLGAYAAMLALYHRSQTGEGQRIDLAMREGVTFLIGETLLDAAMNGRTPQRNGNRHPSMAPHQVYPCRGEDTWIAIAVRDDAEWQRLHAAMGSPTWSEDARLRDVAGRLRHQEEIDDCLAQWTRDRDAIELTRELQAVGVNAGAVLNAREVAADEHVRSRGFIRAVETPDAGTVFWNRPGYVLSAVSPRLEPAPNFAAHNDEVFEGLLGMTAAELEHLETIKGTSRQPISLEAH